MSPNARESLSSILTGDRRLDEEGDTVAGFEQSVVGDSQLVPTSEEDCNAATWVIVAVVVNEQIETVNVGKSTQNTQRLVFFIFCPNLFEQTQLVTLR